MSSRVFEAHQKLSDHEELRRPDSPNGLVQRMPPSTIRSRMHTRFQGKKLCRRCKKIDLDAIFEKKHLTKVGNRVREMGTVAEWDVNSCPLCELMVKVLARTKQLRYDRIELRSLSSNRILDRGWKSIDTVMLKIGQSPFLVPQPKGVHTVRILKQLVSFELVKDWMNYCQEKHTESCGSGDASLLSSIPSFKLIDCETRRIVPASGQPYTTLSYVWGAGSSTCPFSDALPRDVPNTIQDAITVTLALGFRYIWIDRYCINQQIREEVAEQVPKMDLIYNNSYLTIIAAAGRDPHYGLPGIRRRTRLSQPYGRVGKHFLVSAMGNPVSIIEDSQWMTRAWTYQEGVLSRRRLVFTDQQVYFECCGMYCCEVLNLPLPALHTQNGQRFKSCFCDGTNIGMFPRQLGYTAWEVVQRIEEYSQRALTNPSDILNGFLGILRAFEKSSKNIRHCFGVPVLPPPPKPKDLGLGNTNEAKEIHKSYKWSPFVGFCAGLCWDIERPSKRRLGFPSWSWTGWIGNIKWGFEESQWRTIQSDTDLRVRVQLRDTRVLTWVEFENSYEKLSSQVSCVLHVSAWVTPVQILGSRKGHKGPEYTAMVTAADGRPLRWEFRPTTDCPAIPFKKCLAIHLARGLEGHSGLFVMVCELKHGIYERIGFGEMTKNNLKDPNDDTFRGFFPDYTPPELAKSWQEFRLG